MGGTSIRIAVAFLGFASLVAVVNTLAKEPEVTYQFPPDGATLKERPPAIQLCFSEPIDVRDLDKGGEFRFRVKAPDGTLLGHRAIFQPDGYGLVIQPGIPDEAQGEWTFEWHVRDRETEAPADGTIQFAVAEDGEAVIPADPPPCTSETTPVPVVSPNGTAISNGPVNVEPEGGDGPDVLLLALLTTGAAAAAAVIALIGYFVRQRIGFSPHRPSEGSDREEPHH